ncbi:interleukin-12 receptor subunit beta-2-like [Spea bombifrons]|uniref:interleukin-12 receptor subunit beta-2-like n=1 Tax=Spea bombifrons TaxID=233779 RepID=UPI00234B2D7B|nr:interleukin-12 receptor subunit beta-2-like [Spea bombifrons]
MPLHTHDVSGRQKHAAYHTEQTAGVPLAPDAPHWPPTRPTGPRRVPEGVTDSWGSPAQGSLCVGEAPSPTVSNADPADLMESRIRTFWIIIGVFVSRVLIKAAAEMCPAAEIWASPGTAVPLGGSVTVTCRLRTSDAGHPRKCLNITKHHGGLDVLMLAVCDSDSISVRDPHLSPNRTLYKCNSASNTVCNTACKLLCGIYVDAGVSPDRPRILDCEEESGTALCSWEAGRETFIPTSYTLQLSIIIITTHCFIAPTYSAAPVCDGTSALPVTASGKQYDKRGIRYATFPLVVRRGEEFTVTVTASNDLGSNSSRPRTFSYYDAVKPRPPQDVLIRFANDSSDCNVTLLDPQDSALFRLRYRPVNESSWTRVEIVGTKTHRLLDLMPFTRYEFGASCKFLLDKGRWSNWSASVTARTPERAPAGRLDVWHRIQNFGDNTRNIEMFWKNLSASEARGLITHYEVLFYEEDPEIPASRITTAETWLTAGIGKSTRVISVTALNSKGSSPPVYVRVTDPDTSGLSSPVGVAAVKGPGEGLTVTWNEPPESEMFAVDYIVEWEERGGKHRSRTNWMKAPKFHRSVTISGTLQPHVCYELRVSPLRNGRAGIPAKTSGSIKERAPLTGPEFLYKVLDGNRLLVSWKEIPPKKQMGCIVRYGIYVQDASSKVTQHVTVLAGESVTFRQEIREIRPDVQYLVWMTSSTNAGESPKTFVQQIYFRLEGSFRGSVALAVGISVACALFVACVCGISSRIQKLLGSLSRLLPYWNKKAVPDPANCAWAKELTLHKDETGFPCNSLSETYNYDDTETLEIKELDSEDQSLCSSPFSAETYSAFSDVANAARHADKEALTCPVHAVHPHDGGLYKSLGCQPETPAPASDYLISQDITVDYLPTNMSADSEESEESTEDERIPTRYFVQTEFVAGGKLRLDTVKIDFQIFAQ